MGQNSKLNYGCIGAHSGERLDTANKRINENAYSQPKPSIKAFPKERMWESQLGDSAVNQASTRDYFQTEIGILAKA